MPDIFRYSIDNLNQILDQASKYRIPMIALFPNTPNSKKINLEVRLLMKIILFARL